MEESLDGARSGSVLCDGAVGCDDEEDAARHSSGESEVALGRKLDGAVEKDDRGHVCKENVAELDNDVGRGGVVVEEASALLDLFSGVVLVALSLLGDLIDFVLFADEVHVIHVREQLPEDEQRASDEKQLVAKEGNDAHDDDLSEQVRGRVHPGSDEEVARCDDICHDLGLLLLRLELSHLGNGILGPAHEPSPSVRKDGSPDHLVHRHAECVQEQPGGGLGRCNGRGNVAVEHEDKGARHETYRHVGHDVSPDLVV
mmetsp:Transcript_18829/g.38593  ORF Transcript_18829/g.38593 Transcript_18829/m.38593 type:complete len:258 (+) Transcript_18829:1998-2771(+)